MTANKSFDVVIVGGGAAGCVVAGYLAEHSNASILLLEAGDEDRDPLIHIPAGFAKILQQGRHMWPFQTVPQFGTPRPYISGRVLGGGSSINALAYVRGQKRDYDFWQQAAGPSGQWSYERMLEHFLAQERHDTLHNKHHEIGGSLAVQMPRSINPLNLLTMKAFQEWGLPYNPDYNGETQHGVSPVQVTINGARRCNAADAHLRRHLESKRVTLRVNARVTRIILDKGRVTGVELLSGKSREIVHAGHVVVSAGAIHSPVLLKRSGIGPASELSPLGIPVQVDAPDVGENFHDHPCVSVNAFVKGRIGYQEASHGRGAIVAGLRYFATRDGPAASNGIESVAYWNPYSPSDDPLLQCYHTPVISEDGVSPKGHRSGLTLELILLHPRSRGWIRLADADPTSMPLINPNFLGEKDDLDALVTGVRAAREVMAQPSLRDVVEEENAPGAATQSNEAIAEWIKGHVATSWHPVGTCRMGSDPRAVVDPRLRVNGVDGLRVIDASIMPVIVSANTNAPTQALARNGAAMMVEDIR